MSMEERLDRALAARAAPAKDMRFTLEVMRRAEALRFRADAARRLVAGAALAAVAAAALIAVAGWAAENADFVLDAALAVGGVFALATLSRGVLRRLPARAG